MPAAAKIRRFLLVRTKSALIVKQELSQSLSLDDCAGQSFLISFVEISSFPLYALSLGLIGKWAGFSSLALIRKTDGWGLPPPESGPRPNGSA
jgi:hypothetical protein